MTVDDDDYVALYKQALRDHQLTPNPADIQLTRSGVDITPTTSIDELETNITYGNAHFITDNGGIDVYITQNGQQSRLHHYALTFRTLYEMGKSPRKALARIVEKGVDCADERIFAIVYVILVWLATALGGGGMNLAQAHDANVPLKG